MISAAANLQAHRSPGERKTAFMADEAAPKAKRALEEDVEVEAAAEDPGPAGKKQKTEAAVAAAEGGAAAEEQAAGRAFWLLGSHLRCQRACCCPPPLPRTQLSPSLLLAAAASLLPPPSSCPTPGDEADADADMDGGEAAAEEAEAGAEDAEAAANGAAAAAAAAGGPVKLGFRTFANSREAADYLQEVLKKATPHRKLNEVGRMCGCGGFCGWVVGGQVGTRRQIAAWKAATPYLCLCDQLQASQAHKLQQVQIADRKAAAVA